MLENKEKLENKLISIFERKLNTDFENRKAVVDFLTEKFNLPEGKAMDVIAERKNISELHEYELFMLTYAIDQTIGGIKTETYFSKDEINGYKDFKYEINKFDFPIQIKCIQIENDQWVGSCDVNFLMDLRKAQLINYNSNAQRVLKKVTKGDGQFYKIALNKSAINSIKENFDNGSYIPNTITLNIPEDEFDFEYNERKNILIINSIKYFDIADGYHRYIAMCQKKDIDENFNYPMEIRIIHFSDDKIKQFIFQEDQKTKMQKIESASMNMNAPENIIVERLNRDIMFDMKGEIGRNQAKINFSEFAQVVKYFYCKTSDVNLLNVKNELRDGLNTFLEEYSEYIDKNLDFIDMMILCYCIKNNKSTMEMYILIKNKENMNKDVFKSRRPNKRMIREIEDCFKSLEGRYKYV